MKNIQQKTYIEFKQMKNRYTPIVNGIINDFIEVEYESKSIYTVSWINRFEQCITDKVQSSHVKNFILMLHNKYYRLLTNKNK